MSTPGNTADSTVESTAATPAFDRHDHARCTHAGMAAAERLCAARKLRLTPVRARVLEILLEAHQAMGAYDILDRLREEGLGSQPPVVYRALEFLTKHGLAHRIEKLNAYLACGRPEERHAACFLICEDCGTVGEVEDSTLDAAIVNAAGAQDFQISETVVEVAGRCHTCRDEATAGKTGPRNAAPEKAAP